ncbi:MAG: hypothetical protein WCO98_16095, partial [bacterium]
MNADVFYELYDKFPVNHIAVSDGKRRMTELLEGKPTDSLPIIFWTNHNVKRSNEYIKLSPAEKHCYDQIFGLIGLAASGSDGQLAVRANTGCGTIATIAGCTLLPSEYSLPWTIHITKEKIEEFNPDADFNQMGIMPEVKSYVDCYKAVLPDFIHTFLADTQGPFDLAHLLYGDELFYDIYDAPEFVTELMQKVTKLYIRASKMMKNWVGEELSSGYHSINILSNGGVRICEDTSTLLNQESIDKYVIPYQKEALQPFGGGFIHYCGDNNALYNGVINNPLVRLLNFGNPERHDFNKVIPDLIERNIVYIGSVYREPNESLPDYFKRVIGYT